MRVDGREEGPTQIHPTPGQIKKTIPHTGDNIHKTIIACTETRCKPKSHKCQPLNSLTGRIFLATGNAISDLQAYYQIRKKEISRAQVGPCFAFSNSNTSPRNISPRIPTTYLIIITGLVGNISYWARVGPKVPRV